MLRFFWKRVYYLLQLCQTITLPLILICIIEQTETLILLNQLSISCNYRSDVYHKAFVWSLDYIRVRCHVTCIIKAILHNFYMMLISYFLFLRLNYNFWTVTKFWRSNKVIIRKLVNSSNTNRDILVGYLQGIPCSDYPVKCLLTTQGCMSKPSLIIWKVFLQLEKIAEVKPSLRKSFPSLEFTMIIMSLSWL